jgi:signal transduction histidine kinase
MEIANLVFYSIYALLAFTLLMLMHRNVKQAGQPVSKLSYSWFCYGLSNIAFACVPNFGIPAIVLGNLLLSSTGIFNLLIYRNWRTGGKFEYEPQLWFVLACVITYLAYLQYNGTFTDRVLFMTCVGFLMYGCSAVELLLNKKPEAHFQRRLLLGVIGLSLLMLGARLYAILNQIGGESTSFQTESIVTFGMSWSWNTLILLNHLLIASYYIDLMWREELRLTQELKAEKQLVTTLEHEIKENERVNARLTELLDDKNNLLKRLSMAEKSGMLGAMASTLAHELNQPLCASKLNIENLKVEIESGYDKRFLLELLSYIEEDNTRLEKIVQRVNKIFKRGSNQFELVDLVPLVSDSCEILAHQLDKSNIKLTFNFVDHAHVLADYGQIETVVLNFLTNAIEALNSSPNTNKIIDVGIETNDRKVVVYVRDNGTGVMAEVINSVFDPFYSTKKSGMGVGLWLCKAIADAHRAAISVQNNSDAGARFQIEFANAG